MEEKQFIQLIGAAIGVGAQIRETEDGPEAILNSGLVDHLKGLHLECRDPKIVRASVSYKDRDIPLEEALPVIVDFNKKLAKVVEEAIVRGDFPLTLGGDHSLAVGNWNGVKKAVGKPFGLIWVDAHMDAHVPKTSPSGAWHGMPLAALLGHGDKSLAQLLTEEPVVQPEHVCLIGIRSYEEGEYELLKQLNVRVMMNDEVKKRGFKVCFKEAIEHVTGGGAALGVSLDLDVLDPSIAPGIGSPEPDGLSMEDLLAGLEILPEIHALAMGVVEYNPHRDVDQKTLKLIPKIIEAILGKKS